MKRCPLDVLNEPKNAPNFHRVLDAPICYHCKFLIWAYRRWECKLYNFQFGEEDRVELLAEFVCDSWQVS